MHQCLHLSRDIDCKRKFEIRNRNSRPSSHFETFVPNTHLETPSSHEINPPKKFFIAPLSPSPTPALPALQACTPLLSLNILLTINFNPLQLKSRRLLLPPSALLRLPEAQIRVQILSPLLILLALPKPHQDIT